MKISKLSLTIHIIVAAAFSLIIFIAWTDRDFQFWCFYVSARYDRYELTDTWSDIANLTKDNSEIHKLAKQCENDIRYSDPISVNELKPMEVQIKDISQEILQTLQTGAYQQENIIKQEQQVLNLVHKRNEKSKLLK